MCILQTRTVFRALVCKSVSFVKKKKQFWDFITFATPCKCKLKKLITAVTMSLSVHSRRNNNFNYFFEKLQVAGERSGTMKSWWSIATLKSYEFLWLTMWILLWTTCISVKVLQKLHDDVWSFTTLYTRLQISMLGITSRKLTCDYTILLLLRHVK